MRKAVMGDFFHVEQINGNDPIYWNQWGMSTDEVWHGMAPWDEGHEWISWNGWHKHGWHNYLKQLCINLGVGVGSG